MASALVATIFLAWLWCTLFCAPAPALGQTSSSEAASSGGYTRRSPAEQFYDSLRAAREQVRANPHDAKAHYQLGELLRKAGRNPEAAHEYLEATSTDPAMYLAFHELSVTSDDAQVLDEGITRLNTLKEDRPKDLMLRVALSELLEKRKQFMEAARELIEVQYSNSVPERYRSRVGGRIHYLLAKGKEAELAEKLPATNIDDDLDVVPAPVPDTSLRKGLTASKIKESKEMKGMGHVPLLP